MKSHCCIGHDRFGPSRCAFQKRAYRARALVSNEIKISFLRLGNDLFIRERSLRSWVPVDHSAPAIDQASLIKIDKSFFDGGVISVLERVPLAQPTAGTPKPLKLFDNDAAVFVL